MLWFTVQHYFSFVPPSFIVSVLNRPGAAPIISPLLLDDCLSVYYGREVLTFLIMDPGTFVRQEQGGLLYLHTPYGFCNNNGWSAGEFGLFFLARLLLLIF